MVTMRVSRETQTGTPESDFSVFSFQFSVFSFQFSVFSSFQGRVPERPI